VASLEKVDRRTFLFAGFAVALGATTRGDSTQTPRLETLTQWLNASERTRKLALQPCLDRIREMDSSIHAWVQVSPQKPTGHGRLSEIPFAAKDIMETRGLSTEYGSPVYKGRIGTADAAIVRDLRQRGAILLGKTQCTAFAYRTPPATRNPHDVEHTPGGSSSGSAAAVAAGMVPIALGTQTRGSVLRPASYCGVTGFKVSYGLLSMEGILPLAKSLDTLGFFTNTPVDMLKLWELLGQLPDRRRNFLWEHPSPCLRSNLRCLRLSRTRSQLSAAAACPSGHWISQECWANSMARPVRWSSTKVLDSTSSVIKSTAPGSPI
jgi:Asp-tRNA(Asn)/Glu-tRNA(Gln) amidotransferase A subunit family amidase